MINGGNGLCHCWHVGELDRRLTLVEGQPGRAIPREAADRAPFMPRTDGGAHAAPGDPPGARIDLLAPLKERPLGALAGDKDSKSIFDDKLMVAPEYKYDGQKGGLNHKIHGR